MARKKMKVEVKISEADHQKYFQMGRDAYRDGKLRAPVNDKNYMSHLYANPRPATALSFQESALFDKAWLAGWDMENQLAPV